MNNPRQVFTAICIVIVVTCRLIQFFKPFEWQHQTKWETQQAAERLQQQHLETIREHQWELHRSRLHGSLLDDDFFQQPLNDR